MHSLVNAVLIRPAGRDTYRHDPQLDPPARKLGQPSEGLGAAERSAVVRDHLPRHSVFTAQEEASGIRTGQARTDARSTPRKHVMAVSTAGEILLRHGLVQKRRPRQRSPGRIEHSPYEISGAGDSMTADYKGQFRMGNGALCYPLTVADPFSRYVLAIDAMASTQASATTPPGPAIRAA